MRKKVIALRFYQVFNNNFLKGLVIKMKKNKSYTLLIIDGDPALCLLANKKLSENGYHILTASTGGKGIQAIIEYNPDLILLDYDLSDMTGVEVCHSIRNASPPIDKPVLFITEKNDYQSIQNAYQAGATDFSNKPINWTILNYRIQYLLRSYEIYLSLIFSENRLKKAQKIARIANWDYNPVEQSFNWSDTIYEILGDSSKQIPLSNISQFLKRVPEADIDCIKQALEACLNHQVNFEIEHNLISADGSNKIISHLGCVIKNASNQVIDYIGTLQDITERRHTEDKIRELAYYDSLTGLMNRKSFLTILDEILIINKRYKLLSALLFIDLDDFKRINDTLGHDIGDLLLQDVAIRLQQCVRTVEQEKEYKTKSNRKINNLLHDKVFRIDTLDINRFDLGRLGGDEFTVFLSDILNEEMAGNVANRLLNALEQPFHLEQHEIYISFSIGIAISPHDGDNIKTLLKNADTAMYSAKNLGKNNYKFYTQAMNEHALYRLELELKLRNAIKNDELSLVYQPQVCLHTGRLVGAEALMRWDHKIHGSISPSEFIPLAEETGQILAIGDWLFKQFNKNLQHWESLGLIPDHFKLALNVSALQFNQSNIIHALYTCFSDRQLNTHVAFELTESVLMTNAATNLITLQSLSDSNISLSIDDFGTGYSSLSYLHHFPVSTIKIDRTFIFDMKKDSHTEIIKAIIAMAKGMDIKIIAEGIEQQWQADILKQEGCDIGQGFLFHRPLSIESFEHLLQQEKN